MHAAEHSETLPPLFALLGHEVRWQLVRALATGDYRVQELVEQSTRPVNLVSYHLRQLREARLVVERRSSADARDVYYHLDMERLQAMYRTSGNALHPAVTGWAAQEGGPEPVPERPALRMLFLCTHNSARSQMAEGIARSLGQGRVEAFSAGTEPAQVHPDAVLALAVMGIDISQQTSKHLDQFAGQPFDYVVTVCDRAREACPVFPDEPRRIHWSFADPAAISDPEERRAQFQTTARELVTRIRYLLMQASRKETSP